MRLRRTLLVVGVVLLAAPAAASAEPAWPAIPWSSLLPPFPTVDNPQPGPVANCRVSSPRCITNEIRRLRAARDGFGCDHRGVFATTYMTLTRQLKRMLDEDPHMVRYRHYLFTEDALFADFYFRVLRAWDRGDPVPPAWSIALEAADSGDYFGAQDMLLGINAHVQNDMPFLLAALGTHARNGDSRKPDHDAINEVLRQAYQPVVDAVRNRFDPSLDLTNPAQVPLDDAAGLEMVKGWRELVWRNAERLLNAETKADRARVAEQIQTQAAATATLIKSVPAPSGYRATRDAYCENQLG